MHFSRPKFELSPQIAALNSSVTLGIANTKIPKAVQLIACYIVADRWLCARTVQNIWQLDVKLRGVVCSKICSYTCSIQILSKSRFETLGMLEQDSKLVRALQLAIAVTVAWYLLWPTQDKAMTASGHADKRARSQTHTRRVSDRRKFAPSRAAAQMRLHVL